MSLGMSFARRRMMAAAKKETKYVWRVYSVKHGLVLDESTATVVTTTIGQNIRKMASTTFTYADGTFTLTNAVEKTIKELVVGEYLVRAGTANNTSISNNQISLITDIEQSGTSYTLTYRRYFSMIDATVRGDEYYHDVGSDTLDYPENGEQDGLWYVLVKGERTVYVWDVFNIKDNGWKAQGSTPDQKTNPPIGVENERTGASNSSYRDITNRVYYTTNSKNIVISSDGTASGFNQNVSISNITDSSFDDAFESTYFAPKQSGNKHYYFRVKSSGYGSNGKGEANAELRYDIVKNYTQGSSTGNAVESEDVGAYPQNGIQGDYWYSYSHSYTQEFDDR